jgi:hypothetical protein
MEITREFLTKLSSEVNVLGWDNVLKIYNPKYLKPNNSSDKYNTIIYIKSCLDNGSKIQIGYNPTKKITNTKNNIKTKKSSPKSNSASKEIKRKVSKDTTKKSVLASPTKIKKYTYNKKNKFKTKTTGIKYYIERFLLFLFSIFCMYQVFMFIKYCQNIVNK